ncbi:MAG: hypothetical protein ABWZ30_01105 [Jiangellaceae bacterium]
MRNAQTEAQVFATVALATIYSTPLVGLIAGVRFHSLWGGFWCAVAWPVLIGGAWLLLVLIPSWRDPAPARGRRQSPRR